MNVWANAVLTDKGLALQAKLTQGNTLNITRAVTGAGYVTPGLLNKQVAVTDPKQTLTFRPVSYPEQGKCTMPVVLTNDEVETGYTANQVGIYATDPDEGEILYFIAQAAIGSDGSIKGTIIPSATEMPGYSAEWTFYFQYGQADEVTVVVDPANAVTQAGMVEYIDSEIQPMSYAEIDAAIGMIGDVEIEGGSGGTSSGTVVTTLDHNALYNRNAADQHTIESITGLEDALNSAEGAEMNTLSVETAWNQAMEES